MVFRSIPYDYALAGHHRRCTEGPVVGFAIGLIFASSA